MKPHDVGVSELAHDGRLLQEPQCSLLTRLGSEHLDCHVQVALLCTPGALAHRTKLTRAKMADNPKVTNKILITISILYKKFQTSQHITYGIVGNFQGDGQYLWPTN